MVSAPRHSIRRSGKLSVQKRSKAIYNKCTLPARRDGRTRRPACASRFGSGLRRGIGPGEPCRAWAETDALVRDGGRVVARCDVRRGERAERARWGGGVRARSAGPPLSRSGRGARWRRRGTTTSGACPPWRVVVVFCFCYLSGCLYTLQPSLPTVLVLGHQLLCRWFRSGEYVNTSHCSHIVPKVHDCCR